MLGSGDDSTEETAVTDRRAHRPLLRPGNRTVGMLTFGTDLRVDEPERGQNRRRGILESLAMARALGDAPLGNLLIEARAASGGTRR